MMKINTEAKIEQVIEILDKDTNETNYLVENNGKWIKITKEEYYKKLRGE